MREAKHVTAAQREGFARCEQPFIHGVRQVQRAVREVVRARGVGEKEQRSDRAASQRPPAMGGENPVRAEGHQRTADALCLLPLLIELL